MANKYFFEMNENPANNRVGDCAVRAWATFTNVTWLQAFDELCANARKYATMPNDDTAIKRLCDERGFIRCGLKAEKGKKRMDMNEFCRLHPRGAYFVKTAGHVTAVIDGRFVDTWDCGNKCVYWYAIKNI